MNPELAKRLTDRVRAFYETHGTSFAATRQQAWAEQRLVAERIKPRMTVIDAGAGNGRFAKLLPPSAAYCGCEPSSALRKAADERLDIKPGALPHLPFADHTADASVCFAVFHHLPPPLHAPSVAELIRVTKPGGWIAATSWHLPSNDPRLAPVEGGDAEDRWMPWNAERESDQRYIHLFTSASWTRLWNDPRLSIERIGLFGAHDWTEREALARNWFVIATVAKGSSSE